MERTPPARRLETQHAPAPQVEKSRRRLRAEKAMQLIAQGIAMQTALAAKLIRPVYRAVVTSEMRKRWARRLDTRHETRRIQRLHRAYNVGRPKHLQITTKAKRIRGMRGLSLK